MRILYVAYPLLPVSDRSAGGAEQMLATLERQMHARGHATVVAACQGSTAAGDVFATGEITREHDCFDERDVEHNMRVVSHVRSQQIAGRAYDLVHDKGGSFWSHAGEVEAPVLATLHLPRSFYKQELFTAIPGNVYFNCVSESQASSFQDIPQMMGFVRNGIEVQRFPFAAEKDSYLLWLGRICEEKGTHLAIQAARTAGLRLVIAGQVYPFSYHQTYFERGVKPHLDGHGVKFVEQPDFSTKLNLLQHARALLAPSLADETSSLVALEAMACGTPVIGFRRGALPEVVAHGETGCIVDTVEEMAEAALTIGISGALCRQRVERLYSSKRMADDYERLYERVIGLHVARQRHERELAAD
jgi:glycosyltransferase involved in cell wall biosynthesis